MQPKKTTTSKKRNNKVVVNTNKNEVDEMENILKNDIIKQEEDDDTTTIVQDTKVSKKLKPNPVNIEEEQEEEQENVEEEQEQDTADNETEEQEDDSNGAAWKDDDDEEEEENIEKTSSLNVVPNWAKVEEKDEKQQEEDNENIIFQSNIKLTKDAYLRPNRLRYSSKYQTKLHRGEITSLNYHENDQLMLSTSVDGTFKVSAVSDQLKNALHTAKFKGYSLNGSEFIPQSDDVLLLGNREFYYTFDLQTEKSQKHTLRNGKNILQKSAISKDYFCISDSTGRVSLISNKSKAIVNEFKLPSNEISSMTFSSDGEILFVSCEGMIHCFNVNTMNIQHKFKDFGNFSKNGTNCMTVSPNGNYFITGSESGIVNSYNMNTVLEKTAPTPLKTIESVVVPISNIKFHPNNELLSIHSKYSSDVLKLVHYPTHTVYQNINTKNFGKICSMDFSMDGKFFTIANTGGVVNTFNLEHYQK